MKVWVKRGAGLYGEASFARAVPEKVKVRICCAITAGAVMWRIKVGGVDGERWVLSLSAEIV